MAVFVNLGILLGPLMRDAIMLGAYYVPLIFGNSHINDTYLGAQAMHLNRT